jgi:hypothetical protein
VAATSSATSLVVDNGAYFAEHFIVQNTRTLENFRVVSVSTNTLTVVRGVGWHVGGGDERQRRAVHHRRGAAGRRHQPAVRSSNPTKLTNYMQIQREPFDITGTAMSSLNATNPHDWDYQEKKHGIEQAKNIELTGCSAGRARTRPAPSRAGPRRASSRPSRRT